MASARLAGSSVIIVVEVAAFSRVAGMTDQNRSAMQEGPGVGDAAGLREGFVTEHLRRVFLLIYRMVGSVHDAQDLTQEAFIKALQRQDQLRDEQKAAHWLSRIATNTALDFLRRSGRVSFCEIDEAPVSRHADSRQENPEKALLRAERGAWLAEGLERLTPRERAALVLRDVEELPAEEVA